MKISVRNLEPTKAKLTITIDQEEFKPYLDTARKEIAEQITVPGFRKGHVPGKLVDQRVGFGAVAGEAVNKAIPDFYSQALQTKEIPEGAGYAMVELTFETDSEAVRQKLEEAGLPDLDGMTIEVEKAEITDEDVNNRLEALRQRFATLVGVDRPAQNGDFVNIDLDAQIDGESVDSQEGISYEIGSGTMLDGLDEALEGLSAGEETSFESTLEGGEHEGEKALVKVKVNSVKAEELPELDDDFAQEASEFDTLDELKDEIKKNIESDALGMQATKARDAFIARIEEGLEIPAPKGVKEHMIEQQLQSMGTDKDKATADQKKEAEEAVDKLLEDQMVLDALAEKMDVEVSQSDVFNFLASIAQQYGMDPNQFIQAIMRNGQIGSAVEEVARSKGLLAGMRAVSFTVDGESLDLSEFLGSDEAEAEAAVDDNQSVAAAAAAAAVADSLNASNEENA